MVIWVGGMGRAAPWGDVEDASGRIPRRSHDGRGIIKVLDGGVGVGDDDGTMFTSSFNLLSLGLLLSGAGEV